MFGKTGQRRRQCVDKFAAKTAGGPRFERAKVQVEADDGKACLQGGSYIYRTVENAHVDAPRRRR
jgi:hypothetical protein